MSGGDVFPFTPPPLAGGYGIGTVLYSEGDPGSVGAGVVWVVASTGATKVRNAANSGWVTITGGVPISNPMTTAGDMIAGGVAGAVSRLAGAAGVLHGAAGSGPTWSPVLPADLDVTADNTTANATTGHHGLLPKLSGAATDFLNGTGAFSVAGAAFDRVENPSTVTVTATTAPTAQTLITSTKTYPGGVKYDLIFTAMDGLQPGAGNDLVIELYDGATDLGRVGQVTGSGTNASCPLYIRVPITPTAASHAYSFRAWINNVGTGSVGASALIPMVFVVQAVL